MKKQKDLNLALLARSQNEDKITDVNIIQALSESFEPENLGRLAGNYAPKSKALKHNFV